ncbi:hypothetical protein FOCC_FOCC017672 [Frankliniella occidentalis]|uniref:Globin-1 subunit beta n=1 Tax=Frankliniella occidentalis TaxID=133901 RepID=A0A6J1S901_FRAOC|nr:globin-1 subunit beta [Frankliniella occidentalis]KAE8736874.1 hypothetical protein FOCC_FOCC017672 [Frankliniella occidentalis]
MGAILSYLWSPSLSTEVDPATGLSPRDKHLVRTTWAIVKKDASSNGLYLFQLLFTKHTDVRDMFPFARGKEAAEYRDDPRMRAHANAVMYALTSYIDQLDDVPCLDAMVRKLADSHLKRHVTPEHFKALGAVVMQALQDLLGASVMTPDAVTAWTRTYGLVLQVVTDQMGKAQS